MNKNKFVIVGGSNGIGLSISLILIDRGFYPIIVDRISPESELINTDSYSFIKMDLLDFNNDIFIDLANDDAVKGLVITAGFGRVTNFENLSVDEIDSLLNVNTISLIKIIRLFYYRINNEEDFYVSIMGSIAGLVSSPMFSVYAASKAAVCRFVESINIELEVKGINNRILNVSPGSIKGTRFNGGSNIVEQTRELATTIVGKMFDREELYIPLYEEVFKGVIEQYQKDPHGYGLHSYEYKMKSGRVKNE